jgi:hypothetical protein
MVRTWSLAVLVAGFWLLTALGQSRPDALGPQAPATRFSAARAASVLARLLPDQKPHPVGSAQAELVRARILKELEAMGVKAQTRSGMSCYNSPHSNFLLCGTVTNIIAEAVPGQGKAVLLMAHSDSVAVGPGAADDGSGVAILLESIRALKDRPPAGAGSRPVIALFTDGEEADLLGAAFYLRDPATRTAIGAVINVDARGNRGPSYLFQTSKGNGKLIDLYAKSLPHYAASSLHQEFYSRLPNDTDLTPALTLGVPAFNFAFIGGFAQYHTPLDRRENIDPKSLQQQGEAALELTDKLRGADLAGLKGGDAIYLDVLGRWLPRMPVSWALPLSIASFVLIALAGLWSDERRGWRRRLLALAVPPLLIGACVGLGFVLHRLAIWVSGEADPSAAHPIWLRLALAFGAFAPAIFLSRWKSATACWLWFAICAIGCALFAPGLTPYFLFPSLIAAPLLLVSIRGGRGMALFLAALPALTIWIGLNQASEAIMGLQLHALFMISAGFGLLAALPLLPTAPSGFSCLASLLVAVVLAVVAGLQPSYSDQAPERLNLRYAEMDGKAWWLADAVTRLPAPLRAAAAFSASPQRLADFGRSYVASAGAARLRVPFVELQRQGQDVILNMDAPGDGFVLLVPKTVRSQKARVNDVDYTTAVPLGGIVCATHDCGHARLVLRLDGQAKGDFVLESYRQGLPPEGARLLAARPAQAVPSQGGDRTVVAFKVALPVR